MMGRAVVGLLLAAEISAGAIVARVKENDARLRDVGTLVRMDIVSGTETKTRVFELRLKREGAGYRARILLREPESMAGTEFLVAAERGKRNRQWAYFPDLGLTREIAGKNQEDAFLGSDVSYADLAGGAHLDDLEHRLVGEEMVDGEPCYVLEGIPKHRIEYGKLRGWIRKKDFVNVKAVFFDEEGKPIKEAHLTDVKDVGGGVLLAGRIEVRSATEDRRTILTLSGVSVNQGLSEEEFTEEALGKGF
jgi:outer membrane lipoprotein-sorting protein